STRRLGPVTAGERWLDRPRLAGRLARALATAGARPGRALPRRRRRCQGRVRDRAGLLVRRPGLPGAPAGRAGERRAADGDGPASRAPGALAGRRDPRYRRRVRQDRRQLPGRRGRGPPTLRAGATGPGYASL